MLLVCGSRVLAWHPGAQVYARHRIDMALDELRDLGCSHPVLLQGGAVGPERWAQDMGHELGLRIVTYRPDGWRYDTHAPPRRWHEGDPGPRVRNRTMVERMGGFDWAVRVLGLVAEWGPACGTEATVRYADWYGHVSHLDRVPWDLRYQERIGRAPAGSIRDPGPPPRPGLW